MKRGLFALCLLLSIMGLCWAQDPNATVVQGSATGTALPITGNVTTDQGAAGISPWLVNIQSFLSSLAVTQSTSPWIVGFGGVGQPVTQSGAWSVGQTGSWNVGQSGSWNVGQSGTWTVQPGNTANTTAWLVTGTGGTFPATQSGTWNVGLNAGSNTVGKVDQGAGGLSAWKVDGSAVTQPVSGTFWQATQPISGTVTVDAGSGTFTVGGTVTANAGTGTFNVDGSAHTQPVSGTFWQATQPVSATSLPLPTGAATEATLATLPLAQASTTSGQSGVLSQGAVTTGAPTYTTAKTSPLSLTTTGSLRVDGSGATQPVSGTLAVSNFPASQPVSGTVTANQGGTWTVQPGNTANTTAWKVDGSAVTQPVSGTFWQATQPISGTVTANAGTGTFTVDGSGHTQPVSGTVTANQGGAPWSVAGTLTNNNAAPSTNNIGALTAKATAAAPALTEGNQVALSTDLSGSQRVTVTNTPAVTQSGTWNVGLSTGSNTVGKVDQGAGGASAWKVDGSAVTQPVSGTFWQATQPVSGTVTANAGTGTFSTAGTLTNNNAAPAANNVGALPALANAAVPSWTEGNQIALSADLSGGLRTLAQGLVSTANSSTTPLTNSATFTGTGEDVSNYSTVGVYCISAHPGGVPQLHAEFSNDNTNWDINESTSLITGVLVYRTYAVKGKYFRIVLNNGTSAQSALRLQVIYHQNPVPKGQYANDALLVDGSATTQPVSGTVAATQSGTWTVQPGNTANTTAWKVDGSAVTQPVSGTVTANAGTGNFATNIAQVNGSTVVTSATGVQKVGVVGNAGATVDSTVAAGTAPTNQVVVGAVYNTTAPAPTNGQAMSLQADQAGNHLIAPGVATASLSAWNSATALNATQNIFTHSGAQSVLVQLTQTTTLTAGAVTFEVTYDNSTWVTIPADCVIDPTIAQMTAISVPYTVEVSTNKKFLLIVRGAQGLRIKLSTQITGTGTVTPNYTLLAFSPVQQVIGHVSLGSNAGKTNNFLANSLTTTAVTAGQSIVSAIIGQGTTFYISSIELSGRLTAVSTTGSILGTITVTISGSTAFVETFTNPTTEQADRLVLTFAEPIPALQNTSLTVTVTPTATTSMAWKCNIIGYTVNGVGS